MSPLLSLDPLGEDAQEQHSPYPDTDDAIFFDDFIGADYDNITWALTSISATPQNAVGGRVLFRAAVGVGTAYATMANNDAYSAATELTVEWKGKLIPPATGGSSECGVMSGDNPSNSWICWYYNPGTSANFRCQCGNTSGTTNSDSGVAGDNSEHCFKIIISSTVVEFYLDGKFCAAVVNNISSDGMSPYVWCAASGTVVADVDADYVLVTGERA
jgi:hypothetical protein